MVALPTPTIPTCTEKTTVELTLTLKSVVFFSDLELVSIQHRNKGKMEIVFSSFEIKTGSAMQRQGNWRGVGGGEKKKKEDLSCATRCVIKKILLADAHFILKCMS